MTSPKFLPGHFARKGCPGVFRSLPGRKFCTPFIISHFSNFVKKKFFSNICSYSCRGHLCAVSMGGGRVCVRDGQAVRRGWTFVRVAATWQLRAGRGHLCGSCGHRALWTFVCQLETAAAVRPGWTFAYELQTATSVREKY